MPYRSPGPRWLAPAWVVAAVGYTTAAVTAAPSTTLTILKPIPVLVLATGLWATAPRTRHRNLVTFGLLACAVGDVLIEVELVWGLAAFLVGHLWYVVAFAAIDRRPAPRTALAMLLWTGGLVAILWPGLDELRIPVVAYAFVIATMMWRALALLASPLPRPSSVATAAGAVAFGISDSLLALDRFGPAPLMHAGWWVMTTYWAAQVLIARGAATSDRWALAARPPGPHDFDDADEPS